MVKVVTRRRVPTRRDLEVLTARAILGGRKDAAAVLGISYRVATHHLVLMHAAAGTVDDAQLVARYHDEIALIAAEPKFAALIAAWRAAHVEPNGE